MTPDSELQRLFKLLNLESNKYGISCNIGVNESYQIYFTIRTKSAIYKAVLETAID